MLFAKFFDAISSLTPVPPSQANLLAELDPDKIYVENVRSILGVSTEHAKRICETATRQGIFRRRVDVLCPDGTVAASAESEVHLPPTVRCWQETHGNYEPAEAETHLLQKDLYYILDGE